MPFERAIGRLAMNFGALEVRLAATVEDLVSEEPGVGRAVISGRQFDGLVTLFTALVTAKTVGSEQTVANDLAQQLRAVNVSRNSILHAAWLDKEGTDIHAIKTRLNREKRRSVENPMTPAEIADVATKVHMLSEQLRIFATNLRSAGVAANHRDTKNESEFLSGATPCANSTVSVIVSGRVKPAS